MRYFGLIGKGLTHSFSAGFFTKKFEEENLEAAYHNYPMDSLEPLVTLLEKEIPHGLEGLNVTVPFKKEVLRFLDHLDPLAEELGAVNTIRISRSGKSRRLEGFNTDASGFSRALEPLLFKAQDKALVLGTGGSSEAVCYVLRMMNIPFIQVSRKSSPGILDYGSLDAELLARHRLIINTTPLGMYPDTDLCPDLPYEGIGKEHLCYDLIYNPERTLFLERSEARGARVSNGYQMLINQALDAWDIWNT